MFRAWSLARHQTILSLWVLDNRKFCFFFFFSFWLHHVACGIPSSLTRDWTCARCGERAGVLTPGPPGKVRNFSWVTNNVCNFDCTPHPHPTTGLERSLVQKEPCYLNPPKWHYVPSALSGHAVIALFLCSVSRASEWLSVWPVFRWLNEGSGERQQPGQEDHVLWFWFAKSNLWAKWLDCFR